MRFSSMNTGAAPSFHAWQCAFNVLYPVWRAAFKLHPCLLYMCVCRCVCVNVHFSQKKICLARQQPCTYLSRSGGAPVALGFETVASGSDTLCLVASFTLRAVSLPIRAHHVVSVVDYEMQWNEITPNKQLMNIKWESFCLRHFSCGFSDSVIATHT